MSCPYCNQPFGHKIDCQVLRLGPKTMATQPATQPATLSEELIEIEPSPEVKPPSTPYPGPLTDDEIAIQMYGWAIDEVMHLAVKTNGPFLMDKVPAVFMRFCRQYLAREATKAGIPGGWQLVPVEPTPLMISAFNNLFCENERRMTPSDFHCYYRAMLAAAPKGE